LIVVVVVIERFRSSSRVAGPTEYPETLPDHRTATGDSDRMVSRQIVRWMRSASVARADVAMERDVFLDSDAGRLASCWRVPIRIPTSSVFGRTAVVAVRPASREVPAASETCGLVDHRCSRASSTGARSAMTSRASGVGASVVVVVGDGTGETCPRVSSASAGTTSAWI
jgi:hypothetical protein